MNASSAGVRIAVVDDDESLRQALVRLMRSIGHEARGFENAEAFLADGGEPYGCIVSDVFMPGMSGLELLHRLRTGGDATPVILVTARPEPGVRERALASGARCLLAKPYEARELVACIECALSDRAGSG